MLYHRSTDDQRMELLLTFGIAVVAQAVNMQVFLTSAIWTGKLCGSAFIYWQLSFLVLCGTYAVLHERSMMGLFTGALWTAGIAWGVWEALHDRVKAGTMKEAATTELTMARIGSERDINGNPLERGYWPYDPYSPTTAKTVSLHGCLVTFFMLYYFAAGTAGFVFAYISGTLNSAVSSFGLGFLVMFFIAQLLLVFAKTWEPRRLAKHFLFATTVSCVVFLITSPSGRYNIGLMSVVQWVCLLYTGIAEVLMQIPPKQDLDDERIDSKDPDEDWVDLG